MYYAKGEGVPKDDAEAVKWYRKAAEHGYANGQYKLGAIYANGQGVPQDYAEAYVWLSLAAAGGQDDAAHNRDLFAERLTPEELSAAQKRAAELYAEIQSR